MRIEVRRTRPVIYVALGIYVWFLTREYPDNVLQDFIKMYPIGFSVSFIIFLLMAYLFQLRETLEIENGFFRINLKKFQSKIEIAKISKIYHSFERIKITTNDVEISVNISQFSKKKVMNLLQHKDIANLRVHPDRRDERR